MKQKDIAWVSVPFSDFAKSKIRPAVIVSNNEYNSTHTDVVICAITSNLEKENYSVFIGQKDLIQGSLQIPSRIKADKIMQTDKALVLKQFAQLNDKKFGALTDELKRLFQKNVGKKKD